MKRILIFLLLLSLLPLSGCMSRQLEEQLLVIILAVDETENQKIRLTVKVPSHAGGNGGGESAGQGGEQQGYLLLEATGEDFTHAVNVLHATTPRTLNFSQVREVVISDRLARENDFSRLLFNIGALPRMRSAATVIICQGEAKSLAENQKPYVGTRLSRYVETTLANYARKGYVPITTLGEGMSLLGYGFQDPLFALGGVNDFSNAADETGGNELDAIAGQLPRKSANRVELFGAAATDGIRVSGELSGYEMSILHFLWGSGESLSVPSSMGSPVPVYARVPATLGVEIQENGAILKISLICEGHYAPGHMPDAKELSRAITRDIENVIRRLQQLRCDGLGFGNRAAKKYLTVSEWEKMNWRDVYCAAEMEISVSVQLRAV